MANTYTWHISPMQCIPSIDGVQNYVVSVPWGFNGTDGSWTTSPVCGITEFTINPTKPDLIPYDELTKEQVIQWIESAIGEEQINAYKTQIDSEIEQKNNPSVIFVPLPWGQ